MPASDTEARSLPANALPNSTIVSNTATAGYGGGINENDAPVTLMRNSTVNGNTGGAGGGGLDLLDTFDNSPGALTVDNSAIVSNTAANDGGGVNNDTGSTLTMTNSTIAGNTAAGFGGGILTYSSTVALVNDTVAGNTSPNSGGGISIANTNSLSTTLTNSILALNNAPRGPDCNGAFTSGGYNVVGSTSGGCAPSGGMGDVTNRDPRLGPLRDNGGPTLTRALLPDSPAIDLVSPASCAGLTTDQRGFPRPFPVGGACDAGAYEYQPVVTGLSPTSGPAAGGTSVIITGVDLEGATGVSFGGVAATGVVAEPSGRSVMATSPAHAAGPVDVQAAVMAGTGVVTSTATMSGAFTYVAAPPPTRAQPSLRSVPTRRSPRRARRSPRRAQRSRQQAPTRRSRRQTPRSPRSPSSCP